MTITRKPTIIDVAKQAGVSKSTVSLVLRNSPTIRDETRKQVRKAMADIGYVYNRSAANMRSSNAGLVGLVINDLRNPFFTEFATSLQMALASKSYSAVIANTDEDPELEEQVVNSMIEHGVSALIMCPAYSDSTASFDAVARAGVPALQMLRLTDPRTDLFPFSAPEYVLGSQLATRHLIEQGVRRIAFVGGMPDRLVTNERMSGYLDILAQEGLEPVILTGETSRNFGRKAAERLKNDYPDVEAAICFNDLVAIGLVNGCHSLGVKVGHDMLVVGFDDIEAAGQTYPAITSVSSGIAEIGARAAETVVKWLEDGEIPQPEQRTSVELIVRASSIKCVS